MSTVEAVWKWCVLVECFATGGVFCDLCYWTLNLVLQDAVVGTRGFCLNSREFVGLLERIFSGHFFP